MCIALTQPKGSRLTEEEIDSCWTGNPDGGGFAYALDGKVIIVKETFDLPTFTRLYNERVDAHGKDSEFIVHFRWGTQGGTADRNTHPFQVNEELAFCHNGILRMPNHATLSDTVLYNKRVLSKMPIGFQNYDAIMEMIGSSIGGGNKLCFLDKNGETYVVNEKQGHWREDGFWFSNSGYRTYKYNQ